MIWKLIRIQKEGQNIELQIREGFLILTNIECIQILELQLEKKKKRNQGGLRTRLSDCCQFVNIVEDWSENLIRCDAQVLEIREALQTVRTN